MVKGAYLAFYKPVAKHLKDKEICLLNTSISQDQANIVLNKFEEAWEHKPLFSWLVKDIKYSPFPHIIFRNKVVWWFRNSSQDGKFLLGRSYLWINVDEADFARNIKYLIEEVLEPRTWDYSGALDLTTTPRGKRNVFRILQEKRKDIDAIKKGELYIQRGDTRENKFIDQPGLTKRISKMNPRLVLQNIEGRFVESGGLISEEQIDQCSEIASGLLPEAVSGQQYVTAWDLARRSTWLTSMTIRIGRPCQLVHFTRSRQKSDHRTNEWWHAVLSKIEHVWKLFPGATGIDATGLGDVLFEFVPKKVRPIAFDFGTTTGGMRLKHAVILNGVTMCSTKQMGIPWVEQVDREEGVWTLQDELRDLEEDTTGLIWDGACALFIAAYIYKNPTFGRKRGKSNRPPSVVGVKGATRYGTV